jgi:hypothetical protein
MSYAMLRSLFVVAAILPMAVSADDKTTWYGTSASEKYLFVKVWDTWTLGTSGPVWNDTEWKAVKKTSEYIELQLKGTDAFLRFRLYGDKLMANKRGSRTEWCQYAEGAWVKE